MYLLEISYIPTNLPFGSQPEEQSKWLYSTESLEEANSIYNALLKYPENRTDKETSMIRNAMCNFSNSYRPEYITSAIALIKWSAEKYSGEAMKKIIISQRNCADGAKEQVVRGHCRKWTTSKSGYCSDTYLHLNELECLVPDIERPRVIATGGFARIRVISDREGSPFDKWDRTYSFTQQFKTNNDGLGYTHGILNR